MSGAVVVAWTAFACDAPPAPPAPPAVIPPGVVEPAEPVPPPEGPCEGGPVAVIAPVYGRVHPSDSVRVDGTDSLGSEGGPLVGEMSWTLERPAGSSAALFPVDAPETELRVDVIGRYVVTLDVAEVTGGGERVASCEPGVLVVDAVPDGELVAELTWDHPSADLDLHTVRAGGAMFSHEDDVYFSNREPSFAQTGAPWSEDPAENPTLDVDDHDGYGPEITSVDAPAVGDAWTFAVHYWSRQTDGDPRTTARLRVFARGALVADQALTFRTDEQTWAAVDVVWTADVPGVTTPGVLAEQPRPF